MTKRAELALKSLVCTNSYTLPKITTKVLHPLPKMRKRAHLGLNSLFFTNSFTFPTKWFAQRENDKTGWSLAEFAVLYKLVQFPKNCLKVVHPVLKWQNVLISAWRRCFVQTSALSWKLPKSGVLSAKMTKRADLGLKMLFYKTCGLWWKSPKSSASIPKK